MKYCSNCIQPDTRPGIKIGDEGICNACKQNKEKSDLIDWTQRKNDFKSVILNAKKTASSYDCIIPVSGGKDSIWQVDKCLEYGLHPLAVTWRTPARTKIGEHNMTVLKNLGVDHIDFQINPKVEAKFMLQSLIKYGTTALPMHMAIFNIPIRFAVQMYIPLVIWGENSAFEYGAKNDAQKGFLMTKEWLRDYGVTHGTSAIDWVSNDLSYQDLTPYFGVDDEIIKEKGVLSVFLGYYFRWDVETSLSTAKKYGFKVRDEGPKVGLYNYADIDCDFIAIHHYLKWYKFGMTRLFDNLSIEIRNGRLSRSAAIEILKKYGTQRPDEDIRLFCKFVDISESEFYSIIEKFRNKDIWHRDGNKWKIKDFIVKDWEWE